MKKTLLGSVSVISLFILSTGQAQQNKALKACFMYDNGVTQYGWTTSHDNARKAADKALPWLTTKYVEKVTPAQAPAVFDQFVNDKCQVIFTTSFSLMDVTADAARKYPNVIFMNANGYKTAPNMGNYMAEMYQLYYLNGMMAAALSKTGKIGYVATTKIPQLNRHINAYVLGARAVNPNIQVNVKWIGTFFGPDKAKAAAEKLVSEGADALISSEETPSVLQVAQAHHIVGFSHSTSMLQYGPDAAVSGHLLHWENIYINVLKNIQSGKYTTKNMTGVSHYSLLRGGAVELGADNGLAVNPKWIPQLKAATMKVDGKPVSVYSRIMELEKTMSTTSKFDPFSGPITGSLLRPGERPSQYALVNMDWMVRDISQEDMN